MALGIFCEFLVLMAVVSVNQPLFSSEENGIVPENGEEIMQRMKEREVNLQLDQLSLEQEIAAQEARQKDLKKSALELERKIRRHFLAHLCADQALQAPFARSDLPAQQRRGD